VIPRELRTERLLLRQWREDDAEPLTEIYAQPECHHDWPLSQSPVEVGWALHREWWGRGLATEGGRAALELWRERLDDPLLHSFTVPGGDGAARPHPPRQGVLAWARARLVRARPLTVRSGAR
jgi:RimJ/RimL family protein N-acetyltransferase